MTVIRNVEPGKRMRLFITGGSGYVGRNLIRHFVRLGMDVVALARSNPSANIVRALGASACIGDLREPGLATLMQGCDYLIHAAADTDHTWGGRAQERTNVEGTRAVFAAAKAAGIAGAVHLSTESVLLDGHPLVDADETHPFPRKPAGSYSRTKGAAEQIALGATGPRLRVVAVRPRFVWGRDDTTALPQLMKAASTGQLAWIDGGGYLTSTTHVANLCRGVQLALERGRGGQAYFITDDEPVVFRQFVANLLATQGIEVPGRIVPRWVVRAMARLGDAAARLSSGKLRLPVCTQQYAAMAVQVTLDIGKARLELGYAPVIDTAAGMAEMAYEGARADWLADTAI
jgi:nucleoside-diphosphate-sugar epimerase